VSHVINFEIPNISETYVHRIGRTGRAGREGVAISMVNEGDERNHMRDILKLIKRDVPLDKDHQWHLDLPAITSDSKTHKVPKEDGDNSQGQQRQGGSQKGRGGRGGRGPQGQKSQRPKRDSNRNNDSRPARQGERRESPNGTTQNEGPRNGSGEGNRSSRPGGNRKWKNRTKFRGPKPQGDRT